MYLHKFIPRVFFSFQYFWLHGKEEEEEKEVIKKKKKKKNRKCEKPWKEVGIVM